MWLLYAPPVPLVHCASVNDLPSRANGILGVWLSGDPERVSRWLHDIRHHCAYAYLPVFTDAEVPADLRFLCDGVASTAPDALRLAQEWCPSVSCLQGPTTGSALALARYLYLRPFLSLAPVRDCGTLLAYRYPLLEAFTDGQTPQSLLGVLMNRGWLERTHLVARLHQCEVCHSVHLNHVDLCPVCEGLNVEEEVLLRCVRCQSLVPMTDDGDLSCAACGGRAGVAEEGSRALRQLYCTDCTMRFKRARRYVCCLSCGSNHLPDRLPVISIATYILSGTGRQAAKQGMEAGFQLPGAGRVQGLVPEAFIEVTDWLMSLARRHGQPGFTLIGLYLDLTPELHRYLGESRLSAMLDAFASHLGELLRDTDILTRVNDRLFWVALPQTTRAGGQTLLEKIQSYAQGIVKKTGSRFGVRGVIYSADEIPGEVTAEHLLMSLGNRLQRDVSC